METNEVVKSVMENEEVGAQVSELIEAGKNVVVDLQSDGSAVVTEVAKAGFLKTYGPILGVAGGGLALGIGGTLLVQKLINGHKEKKEAAEIEKAFKEKAEAEAKKAEANGGKVDDAEDAKEAKSESKTSEKKTA